MAEWEEFLDQRRQGIEMAAYFAKQLIEELGKEKALEILSRAFEKYTESNIKKALEGVPLEKRFEEWGERMERNAQNQHWIRVETCMDKEIAVKVTSCAAHQIFSENGLTEVCQKYCDSDFATAKLIHPKARLILTKRLAYGDDHCNHRWVLED
jgi:hypothetical protein